MEVYRITLAKWANSLVASGRAARWNGNGKFVIYTAASRALACLENVVHRSGEGLNSAFKVMVIHLPDDLVIQGVNPTLLPPDWKQFTRYPECQQVGNAWLDGGQSAVLKVPSAVIPSEYNYLINPQHPDFARIRLLATEDFYFDPRIKAAPEY